MRAALALIAQAVTWCSGHLAFGAVHASMCTFGLLVLASCAVLAHGQVGRGRGREPTLCTVRTLYGTCFALVLTVRTVVAVFGGGACRLWGEAAGGTVLAVRSVVVGGGVGVGAGDAGFAVGRGVASSGVEVAAGATRDARRGTQMVLVSRSRQDIMIL